MTDRATVEDFYWTAVYADGALSEVDQDGTEHGWAEIDQSRLRSFCLLPSRPGLPSPVLRLDDPDSRPVYFRRRVVADVLAGSGGVTQTVTVLGWQRTVAGRCVKSFVAFYSDGSVLVSDRDDF